jgi:hypothetical protein
MHARPKYSCKSGTAEDVRGVRGEGGAAAAHERWRLRPRAEMSANSALTLGSSTAEVRAAMAGP